MPLATSYNIRNDRAFQAALERARRVTGDLRLPFTLIAKDFYKSQRAIWDLKGAGQYPDLAESTKIRRKSMKRPGATNVNYPILLGETGDLRDSMTNPKDPNTILEIGKTDLTIGTKVPYGIYHQSDSPRSKIPLRKFLFIGPEAPKFAVGDLSGRPERWLKTLNDYVVKKMKEV